MSPPYLFIKDFFEVHLEVQCSIKLAWDVPPEKIFEGLRADDRKTLYFMINLVLLWMNIAEIQGKHHWWSQMVSESCSSHVNCFTEAHGHSLQASLLCVWEFPSKTFGVVAFSYPGIFDQEHRQCLCVKADSDTSELPGGPRGGG